MLARAIGRHALLVLIAWATPAVSQAYPSKPIRMIVPFPPGGSADALCRRVSEKLTGTLGQPVAVENRAGGGGNIGADIAARAEPDGHTLLCSPPGPLAINHNLYKVLPYDPTQFVPVTILAVVPNVISARLGLPANTVAELFAHARAAPVQYASQGIGTTSHLGAEMLATMAGIKIIHVPYSEGPALVDIAAGRVDIFICNLAAALRFERDRQLKFLGLASRARSRVAPDVPSAVEFGLPDFVASAWFAIAAPPGTPDAIIQKLNAATSTVLALPEIRTSFLEQGAEPVGGSTAATATFIREEEERWRAVIRSTSVSLD